MSKAELAALADRVAERQAVDFRGLESDDGSGYTVRFRNRTDRDYSCLVIIEHGMSAKVVADLVETAAVNAALGPKAQTILTRGGQA